VDLRQECFLFELPYDARLNLGLMISLQDDPNAQREQGWADFDLQSWLARENPGAPLLNVEGTESMLGTTLIVSEADRPGNDPLEFVRLAWPDVFRQQLREHPWPRRLLYYRPVVWLREHLPGRLGIGGGTPRYHTVLKAVRIAPKPGVLSDAWRLEQLRSAHNHLRTYLAAATTEHGDPELRPITIQDLPAMVLGYGSDIPHDPVQAVSLDRWMYLVHERIIDRPRAPIGQAAEKVALRVAAAADNPMFRVMVFLTSSHQAAYRGEFTHAVVDAGTSVEMLMAAAFQFSAPEHGYSNQKVANVLGKSGLKTLLVDHCARLFGYDKDLENSNDALGSWWQTGYELRNRVVHAGQEPSAVRRSRRPSAVAAPSVVVLSVSVMHLAWSLNPVPSLGPENPDRWPIDHWTVEEIQSCLERMRAGRGRVPTRCNAHELNYWLSVSAPVKRGETGLAACEDCRVVFEVKRRRKSEDRCLDCGKEHLTGTHCAACAQERRANTKEFRRRRNLAYWRADAGEVACLGCMHDLGRIRMEVRPARPGGIYCSEACRKLMERFAANGGHFESRNHGVTVRDRLIVPIDGP
jgi:hypothetical protein